jgi:hypothetical protein
VNSQTPGEINVSSVFPKPDEAPAEIARRVAEYFSEAYERAKFTDPL